MKRFTIAIRWRGYRWALTGLARSSADLLAGLVEHLPFGCSVCVKLTTDDGANRYAEHMIRRDQMQRLTGAP